MLTCHTLRGYNVVDYQQRRNLMINVRQKGASGEREIAVALEAIIRKVMVAGGVPTPLTPIVQRNQNQSAVGGSDLTNTFGLAIEVKRQENLSVNTWWKQCELSAQRNNELPVLVYRQSRKPWKVVQFVWLQLPNGQHQRHVGEVSWDAFLAWFELWVKGQLNTHGTAMLRA
jgi:hypothetical protein